MTPDNDSDRLVTAAKRLQEKMEECQAAINALEITGGAEDVALVTLSGEHEMLDIALSDALCQQAPALIREAILAAHEDARQKLQKKSSELVGSIPYGE